MKRFGDGRDWFFEKRFGLFLHWGIYAIEGYHEQDQMRRRIPRDVYGTLTSKWNPTEFCPDKWLDLAEEAGMEYLILTTKHHDGFCLFKSEYTDFHVGNTPFKRDIVKEVVDACHRRDFPVGLYYSVVDWHHPNYPNQGRHHELPGPEKDDDPDLNAYMLYLKNQVRELCTHYGEIHAFWWDMNVPEHRDPSINAMIRDLQPDCVINPRGMDKGDFRTPEREWDEMVHASRIYTTPTEACNSVGTQSWGYRRDEAYYSDLHLMQGIAGNLAKGGNYLLNVGPDATGVIPYKSAAILKRLGAWVSSVQEALWQTEPASDLTENSSVLLTRKNNTIYMILSKAVTSEDVILKPIISQPRRITLLNTGQPLESSLDMLPWQWEEGRGYLRICQLPINDMLDQVMVIKLEFDADIQLATPADIETNELNVR